MKRSPTEYPAKFVMLTDSEIVLNTKRNYFTWIISVTVIFGVTVGFVCYKVFIGPNYFNGTLPQTSNAENDSLTSSTPRNQISKTLYPKIFVMKKASKDHEEFPCEEIQPQVEAIPHAVKKKVLQRRYSEDIYHYINANLLVHYEVTINKHDTKYLKLAFNDFQLKLSLVRNSVDFVDFMRDLPSNRFKFYAGFLKKHKFNLELNEFYWFFALTEELNHWYNYLDRLRIFLSDYEQQKTRKSFENVTYISFATFTEETQKKLFHFVYPFVFTEKKLIEINEVISEWTKPVHVNRTDFSLTLFNTVILLSEVREQLQTLNLSGLKNVHVYASRILYLDTHLELLGINLAIIAPKWDFLKQIRINLDGPSGEEHSATVANEGLPGSPGNPGDNGGDFLGVGSFHDKFLFISTNGGEGGRGQNGAKGHDGLHNTRPSPPFGKPDCVIQIKKLENLYSQKIIHYEIYSEAGCGGAGTDGGVGGEGGHGGVITLMRENSLKITKGSEGASGSPGKGGPGGTGGRNGCFYEAVDENDEFLHPITTIKCPAGNVLPSGKSGKDNFNTEGQVFPPVKKNLSVKHCIFGYIQLAREHFVKNNDPYILSFLRELNNYEETKLEDILSDFKSVEKFKRMEFFELFKKKLWEHLRATESSNEFPFNYLKSIVLGEMIYLMDNINYYFVDMRNYLNIFNSSVKNVNVDTRELEFVSYFKRKVKVKVDRLRENLKLLKEELNTADFSYGNGSNYSPDTQKRISCVIMITIDVITFLMNRSSELTNLELNSSLNLCLLKVQANSKEQSENLLLEHHRTSAYDDIAKAERILLKLVPPLIESESEIRGRLVDLKDALDNLEESSVLSDEKKKSVQILIDEVEHFIALYYFIEWEKYEESFSYSLNGLTTNSSWNSSTEFLKTRLLDVMVAVQLKLGEDAFRQKFYPARVTASLLASKKKTFSDVFVQINLSKDSSDGSPYCKNHIKAIFDKNSSIGEFFSWPNTEIKDKLKVLFSGAEINLKSNLINSHVLDKSFLQFNSLKLDFVCLEEESVCEKLRETLSNFKIDITHSGYSYYNWRDETHFVVSEKVTLSYSFKTRNNQEPELYNSFFKKCQEGEIKLSPFTTWTVRLLPINERANFNRLASFADIVSLSLIGTGTYIV